MAISEKLKKIGLIILKLLPVKKCVVFDSFHGLYNDNPRYISEELYKLHPEISQYWVKDSKSVSEFPEHAHIIKPHGFYHDYLFGTARVVVDNFNGIRRLEKNSKSRLAEVYTKDKKRKNISTWHGTPLKKSALTPQQIIKVFTTQVVII